MNDISKDYRAELTYTYVNVTSHLGNQWYEHLALADYPSYLLFNADGVELSRFVGEFDRDHGESDINQVLNQ